MSNSNNDILLAISTPPFWHCGRTIRKNSLHTLLALAPTAVLSLLQWGMPAARVMALAVVASLVTEAVCQILMKQKLSQDNGTAAITGLLLAFLLPASAPWWLVVIAAVCAMGIGRMAFGGYGANQVNATLVGWALVFVSFPLYMDPTASILQTSLVDPLLKAKYFGGAAVADFPLTDLLLGRQLGGLGAAQSGALFLGGMYLALRGVIRWEIPCSFLIGVFVSASALHLTDSSLHAGPLFHLFSGSTMLAAFFLATEDSCCPHRRLPMLLYGLTGGILVLLIRTFGIYTDGAPFAVMLINLLAPMFALIRSHPFGTGPRKAGRKSGGEGRNHA